METQTPIFQITSLSEPKINDNALQLSPIQVDADYCKEWNVRHKDFVVLTKNGDLVSNFLYRVGGLGCDIKKDYFLLLKYVQAIYDMDFLKKCYPNKTHKELTPERKHLENRWCIIDKNGVEKKEFSQFKSPYIIKDSCIYSLDGYYHNIETDEFYCHAYKSMESSQYLFLENLYSKEPSKKGIMKINKKDGSWSVFN